MCLQHEWIKHSQCGKVCKVCNEYKANYAKFMTHADIEILVNKLAQPLYDAKPNGPTHTINFIEFTKSLYKELYEEK